MLKKNIRKLFSESDVFSMFVEQFYGLDSFTVTKSKEAKSPKMTKIEKKQLGSVEIPNITLSSFLKMSKEGGIW